MTTGNVDLDDAPFSPAGFARRAAERLRHDGGAAALAALPGDHVLNPGFVMGEGALSRRGGADPDRRPRPAGDRAPHACGPRTSATHAGQIAFPGGKIDPTDASPTDAALREAEEEIGLDRAFVTPVGTLDPYLTGTGYRIVPVVAMVDPGHRLTLNPHEVVNAFEVPLAVPDVARQSPARQPGLPRRHPVLL